VLVEGLSGADDFGNRWEHAVGGARASEVVQPMVAPVLLVIVLVTVDPSTPKA
jgi:hypothetical protein